MNVEIAERLAKRRREAGYSQESLAERLGVTRQAVSKWERSESSPDTDNLIGLAKLYGVSLDELLNVDPSIADDVDFEAADKARAQGAWQQVGAQGFGSYGQEHGGQEQQARTPDGQTAQDKYAGQSTGAESFTFADDDDDEFKLTDDDGSTVNINWRDGVHIKDGKTGEEVRVGWSGIHINEKGHGGGGRNGGSHGGRGGRSGSAAVWTNACDEDFSDAHLFTHDGWDAAKSKHKAWFKFPIYVLVILAYLLLGFFAPPLQTAVATIEPWVYGIFLIAIIPTYYMLVHAIVRKSAVRFMQGFYPFACVVFFLWMWLIMGIPHPTWVVFLTIPIVEWICRLIRKGRRRLQKEAAGVKAEVTFEVDADKVKVEVTPSAESDKAAGSEQSSNGGSTTS